MANGSRYNDYSYIQGNAARQLQPAYEPERRQVPEVEPKRDRRREEQIRRNREKSNVIDFKYSVIIVCACVMIFASCISYLKVQAQISAQKTEIASLQTTLNQLTNENVAKEELLNSSVDLSAIYQTASEKLGMQYADASHTILYESADPDYVKQYQNIPDSK